MRGEALHVLPIEYSMVFLARATRAEEKAKEVGEGERQRR